MLAGLLQLEALHELNRDGRILFATRFARLFAYGFVSIILMLYLKALGLTEARIGLLISLTLAGDTAVSLWLTTTADRTGRRRMLVIGALLMAAAGVVFGLTANFWLLLLAATIGVISPSGNEVGPFLSIEQAGLSQIISAKGRTAVFAWYNLAGSVATACGALAAGLAVQAARRGGFTELAAYRTVVFGYALVGAAMSVTFCLVSKAVEVPPTSVIPTVAVKFGLHKSRPVVMRLSALFALDAFGGGFVLQMFAAYWFHLRWGLDPAALGGLFFGANVLAGFSGLVASRLAARFGLINTMVFTHVPSNVLLILVPLMPNMPLAVVALLARFSISQMDVPTRQSYTMAVVSPDERSAAAGVTGVARSAGAALSPSLAGKFLAASSPLLFGMPFFLSGGLKIVYDLLLYRAFKSQHTDEEHARAAPVLTTSGGAK